MKLYVVPIDQNLFKSNGRLFFWKGNKICQRQIRLAETTEHAWWLSRLEQMGFWAIHFDGAPNGYLFSMTEQEATSLFRRRKINFYIRLKRRRKFGRRITILSPKEAKTLNVVEYCVPVFYQYFTS